MSEARTHYEVIVDNLNNIEDIDEKLEFINNIDFSKKIEKDSDAEIVSSLRTFKEGLQEQIKAAAKEESEKELETDKLNQKLEAIAMSRDPIEIEQRLQEIKEKNKISIKILRDRVKEIKKEFREDLKDIEVLPCNVDPRFEQEDLLIHISKELDKDHIGDDREKLGTFIAAVSSELPDPKDHVSVAHKGDSSAGKTNVQLSVIKHFPKEHNGIATRITQSEMEDRIQDWKRLVITEINKNREGANTEITETFKQVMEDGIRIYKKDSITREPREIVVPQKTGFYATTETETDDELETRYIVIPVRGSESKNRAVVSDTLKKVSDIDSILNKLEEPESWIAESIRGLNSNLDVAIPFAKEINKSFETEEGTKELFDYSKERVKRDSKRLISLTKAIAWLFQKRRIIVKDKVIIAEPTDFLTALKIFIPFFNVSYSGLDPRIEDILNKIKNLEGKFVEEIQQEFGSLCSMNRWVIRTNLQKELGISLNTLKAYIKKLKDIGLIDTYWEESHPKYYLIRPVSVPVSRLLDPITLYALTGHLQGNLQVLDRYKKHKNNKKGKFDTIPLVKKIEFDAPNPKLTGVKLTGGFSGDTHNTKQEAENERINM